MLAALPFFIDPYRSFQITLVMGYMVALLGLNVVTGYGGQISLGHGAFVAIGAYATAILMNHFELPYWLCVPAAGLLSLIVGLAFGLPALRLHGPYLALATFALGVCLPQLLKSKPLEGWTGGVQGLHIAEPPVPWGLPLSIDTWLYLFTLTVAATMFLLGRSLVRGPVGLTLIAIRDAPIAAAASGIAVARFKTAAFGISALYAGVAGALGAIAVPFIAPDSFTTGLSISLLVGVVVGGLASTSGAIYGAVFIVFAPNLADGVSKAAPWAVFGAALIGFMLLMPSGIHGAVCIARAQILRSFKTRRWRQP
ncbi:MAG TPA: branched-chain amino acid ABC transporter permease [Ideonella sp.]|nr:branched-chain amino acid ABC transporter permease [Ideonella sp.]